ncbi:DUF106 domain-containing protein [Candidatus Woesearchaeota archaeon]|nr:DUF106 domain-containing protein [Candidatus Woesearchaeota archaeon]
MVFDSLLNPVFSPLLRLDPLLAIVIIAVFMSAMITVIYKYLTDQNLMKQLKAEIKDLQAEMKKLKDNPKKMMQVQKQAMETNTKYMMHSMKPTLFTFIPIIIIFGWLNAHMAYMPIVAGEDFGVNVLFDEGVTGQIEIILPNGVRLVSGDSVQDIAISKAEWVLNAESGEYSISYNYNDKEYSQSLIVSSSSSERIYAKPIITQKDLSELKNSGIKSLNIANEKIRPLQRYPVLRSIPWIGGFGWLGTYIILSIITSMLLRKFMKIY